MIFRHLKRIIKCHISYTKEKVNIYFGVQFGRIRLITMLVRLRRKQTILKLFPEALRPSTEKRESNLKHNTFFLIHELHIPTMIKITLFIILKGRNGNINSIFGTIMYSNFCSTLSDYYILFWYLPIITRFSWTIIS